MERQQDKCVLSSAERLAALCAQADRLIVEACRLCDQSQRLCDQSRQLYEQSEYLARELTPLYLHRGYRPWMYDSRPRWTWRRDGSE